MRGSIQRRGDRTWRISVELDRDPRTGARRRRWETVHGTKREAEARLAELIREVETGTAVDPSRITVAEWLRRWLDQHRQRVRATTAARYAQVVDRLVRDLGRHQLQRLRPAHIADAEARWLSGGMAPATALKHHRVLSQALDEAVRLQLLARNPADAVRAPSAPAGGSRVAAEALARVPGAVADAPPLWRSLILVLASTGLRRGEALGLQWPEVDLDAGLLRVVRTRTLTAQGEPVEGPPKTRSGERVVPLVGEALAALREWRRAQAAERLAAGAAWQGGDWVWATARGPVSPHSVTHWWQRRAREHGLPLRLHDLRHGAATLMAAAGIPPRVIAEVLGHSRPSFTLDVYAGSPDLDALRRAVEAVDRALRAWRARSP